MVTREPVALRKLALDWEMAIDTAERRNDAATFSGIVGDLAHRLSGGYHISREDQPASNYSVATCPEDRQGPSDLAAAIDMNMMPTDMKLVTGRLYASWKDQDDPRLNYCRGINGTLDGKNAIRFDCQFGTQEPSTSDHTWHVHLEVLRKWVENAEAMRAILSVILGQTTAQWRAGVNISTTSTGTTPAPLPTGGASKMYVIARAQGDPQLWLCDGINRRKISAGEVNDLKWLASQGAIPPLWQDGKVWDGLVPAFGQPILSPGSLTLDAGQVDQVAAKVADLVAAAVTKGEAQITVDAVKKVLREGVGAAA